MKSKVFKIILILIILLNVCLPVFGTSDDVVPNNETYELEEPEIVSEAGFMMEVNSGNILYSNNVHLICI